MPLWRTFGLRLGLVALAWGGLAFARTPERLKVALEYRVDAALTDCPSQAELSTSVAKQLGYEPFSAELPAHRLRVEIARSADRPEARIEWIDPSGTSEGERSLPSEGRDCSELRRSLPFAISVQVQLHASLPPEEPPRPLTTPLKAAVTKPAPKPAKPTLRHEEHAAVLGAGLLARYGLAPGISPGLRVFGAFARGRWWFELSGHATSSTELSLDDGSGFAAREEGLDFAPCWHLSNFGLCGVGALGLLHVRGQGVDHVARPSSWVGGAGGRVQLLLPATGRLGLLLRVEALALLTPRDILLNEAIAWSTSPVVVTANLDFAAIFR